MAVFDLTALLNGKSTPEAAGPAPEVSTANYSVTMLDIEDLAPSPDNFYSTENIEELAAAIELAGGVRQNLIVKPEAHGKYEIIAGHRRRLAVLRLVNEGKEDFRLVPCHIQTQTDTIKDRLTLILTNSTARQLTAQEEYKQALELREVLTEYKKALEAENKEKPKEEKVKLGRIREIVAGILQTSTTQIGRYEQINNNLSPEFKQEFEAGNINVSTAHELSRLDEEKQAQAFNQYEEAGELHIKDVKEEKDPPDITEADAEIIQAVLTDAITGKIKDHILNGCKDSVEIQTTMEKAGKEGTFKKIQAAAGVFVTYRILEPGLYINYLNGKTQIYPWYNIAEIIKYMIDAEMITKDPETPAESADTENKTEAAGDTPETETPPGEVDFSQFMNPPVDDTPEKTESSTAPEIEKVTIIDYLEEKGGFTSFINNTEGAQFSVIKGIVKKEFERANADFNQSETTDLIHDITNRVSAWINSKSAEYFTYLKG